MDRPKRSFIRVQSPAKEAGIGSLRIGSEMWNYLPKVERIAVIAAAVHSARAVRGDSGGEAGVLGRWVDMVGSLLGHLWDGPS